MDHYSFTYPSATEALLVDPQRTLTTKWSHFNHRSGIGQGKPAS